MFMTTKRKIIWRQGSDVLSHPRPQGVRSVVAVLGQGLCLGLLAAIVIPQLAVAQEDVAALSSPSRPLSGHEGAAVSSVMERQALVAHHPKRVNFEREHASAEVRHVADWVIDSGDNYGMPFAIVDKRDARVFVFEPDGRLRGAAPVLLGLARGDDSVPGIGDRPMASIRPEERTTPAGRFLASLGRNLRGKKILWVDYEGAVSMHSVVSTKPEEHRLQRLTTPTPLDNRISYGCINVPAKFFDNVVRPAFTGTNGIVYVLPETRRVHDIFASYDVEEEHERLQSARQPVPAQVASGGTQTQGVSLETAHE